MEEKSCPICYGPCEKTENEYGTIIDCGRGHSFSMNDSMKMLDPVKKAKCYNLIAEILLRTPCKKSENGPDRRWKFFFDETKAEEDIDDTAEINLANNMQNYPESTQKK